MTTRHVDLITSAVVAAVAGLLLLQLEGIPREGVLFPAFVLWVLMACAVALAGRALWQASGTLSFFGGIDPKRWCLVSGLFLAQVFGALFVSFKISMFVGMFAILTVLTPQRTTRNVVLNAVIAGLFVVFFQVFFTDIMHIFFPEPLFE